MKRRAKKISEPGIYVPKGEFIEEPLAGDEVTFKIKKTTTGAFIATEVRGGTREQALKTTPQRCTIPKMNERGYTFAKMLNSNQRIFIHVGILNGSQEKRLKELGKETIDGEIIFARKSDGRCEALVLNLLEGDREAVIKDEDREKDICDLKKKIEDVEKKFKQEQEHRRKLEAKLTDVEGQLSNKVTENQIEELEKSIPLICQDLMVKEWIPKISDEVLKNIVKNISDGGKLSEMICEDIKKQTRATIKEFRGADLAEFKKLKDELQFIKEKQTTSVSDLKNMEEVFDNTLHSQTVDYIATIEGIFQSQLSDLKKQFVHELKDHFAKVKQRVRRKVVLKTKWRTVRSN